MVLPASNRSEPILLANGWLPTRPLPLTTAPSPAVSMGPKSGRRINLNSIHSAYNNVTAMSAASDGRLFLTTSSNTSATGLSAANEDVFAFRATRLGSSTSGSFDRALSFDGSLYGLSPNALMGIHLPA